MQRKDEVYIEVHPMDYVLHKEIWERQLEEYELAGTPIYPTISIPRRHARFVAKSGEFEEVIPLLKPSEWKPRVTE